MSDERPIYLDNHATTRVDPRVAEAMWPYFVDEYGNASSVDHDYGTQANRAVERARKQLADLINADPEEIVFTSGATESDNIALFGAVERYRTQGNHVITCVTEHKAVLDACERLEALGTDVTYMPVDGYGRVDPADVRDAIREDTILVSIMTANNEIGTIAPVAEIGEIAHEAGVLFHTDAAQAVGHIPMDVQAMRVDMLSVSAHKFHGPKGVGALYVRRMRPRVRLAPVVYGGGHERGMRSGTLNVPGIVGLGEAAEIASREMDAEAERFREWMGQMLEALQSQVDGVELNGHPTERLPHNLNVYVEGVESKSLVLALKDRIAFSTGSACTTEHVEPTHVIQALGLGEDRAHSSVRFGFGRFNTDEDIAFSAESLAQAVQRLRRLHV